MKKNENKILFIGDIHGLNEWEDLAKTALKKSQEIVFLGDYVDSFFIPAKDQLHNLNNLCNFVRKHKEKNKITLLLGNHDYAYIYGFDGISGKQHMHAHEYVKIFNDNIDLFQIAWGYTNEKTKKYTLATHAGITHSYYKFFLEDKRKKDELIHETLNSIQKETELLWKVGRMRGGRGTPGPLWADLRELVNDPHEGINQVVGHTPQLYPRLDYFSDDFIACIDDYGNNKVVSMEIAL